MSPRDKWYISWVIAPLSIAHSPIFNNPAPKPTALKCFAPRHFNPLSYLTKVREYWLVVCMFFLPQGGGCRGYRLTAHHVKVKVSVVAEKGPTLAAGAAFTDVALVLKDGQPLTAHSDILSSTRPFFRNIHNKNIHHDPLVYTRPLFQW